MGSQTSLITKDKELFEEFSTIYLKNFNKKMGYGTAGFRAKAEFLKLVNTSSIFVI